MDIQDKVQQRQYSDITVGQLITQLVELPPMMPIFIMHHPSEDVAETNFFTGISIEEGNRPILLIHASHLPEARRKLYDPSYEEKVDEKREKARQMQYNKDKANKPADQYS